MIKPKHKLWLNTLKNSLLRNIKESNVPAPCFPQEVVESCRKSMKRKNNLTLISHSLSMISAYVFSAGMQFFYNFIACYSLVFVTRP